MKSYVDGLHENSRKRRDMCTVSNDQDNEFDDNKLTNRDSNTVNRGPKSKNELLIEKYIDNSLGEGTIRGLNKTLENYVKHLL